ncbi:zinc-binding dehydrogenase [Saccharopolyspora gloriosae]|uniref:zinc-binding dehydrogenase n=1 Tax=Saccharopolyspora gloriosae TaxID=455344 RepID=UPI001FB57516|nr:zinc-binding dehydrogenase [Saccharopolyspora gloriosae]
MTARAAVWDGERFLLREFAHPELGAGEVLVRVRMATICGSDLHTLRGDRPTPLPAVLGHEAVGEVVAAGPAARTRSGASVEPGMRLTWTIGTACGSCARCRRGLPQKCTEQHKYGHAACTDAWALNGGFADHCHLLAGTGLVEVPPDVPDAVITPANCATATVVGAVHRADPDPAGVVVVQGCGMLGLTAVAYLRHLGVRSIVACDPDAGRRDAAGAFGAAEVTGPDGAAAAVRRLSGGEGAVAVLELSGSNAAIRSSWELLAIGGHLALVGSVSPADPVGLSAESVVRRLLTVSGSHNYGADDLVSAVDFLARGARHADFAALVPRSFPLGEVDAAVAFAERARVPRVALVP